MPFTADSCVKKNNVSESLQKDLRESLWSLTGPYSEDLAEAATEIIVEGYADVKFGDNNHIRP